MVQINIVTSIAIVALLLAPATSMPLPAETLDVNERDINMLQSRQFGFINAIVSAAVKTGTAAKSVSVTAIQRVVGKPSAASKMIKNEKKEADDKHHGHDHGHEEPKKKPQAYVIGGIGMATRRKRDILDMEERSRNYHDLNGRGRA